MTLPKQLRWAAFVIAVGLMLPARSPAGLIFRSGSNEAVDGQTASYSPLHYIAPSLYTFRAHHRKGTPNPYPGLPPRPMLLEYSSPAVRATELYYYRIFPLSSAGGTPRVGP
jgi:hypothetical protein